MDDFLQLHEFDELRFDVRVHDCTYFLRASSVEEKQSWIDGIEANKVMPSQCHKLAAVLNVYLLQKWLVENGFDSNSMRRQGSILSLSTLSIASTSSYKVWNLIGSVHRYVSRVTSYIIVSLVNMHGLFFIAEEP